MKKRNNKKAKKALKLKLRTVRKEVKYTNKTVLFGRGSCESKRNKYIKDLDLSNDDIKALQNFYKKKGDKVTVKGANMFLVFRNSSNKQIGSLIKFFIAMDFDYMEFANTYNIPLEEVINEFNWELNGGKGTFRYKNFLAVISYDYDWGTNVEVVSYGPEKN